MELMIERFGGGAQSLEDFAARHGLRMRVTERPKVSGLPRYVASFEGVEIRDGGLLVGAFGDGETPEAAITDYARRLEGQRLVLDAYQPTRKVFDAPNELIAQHSAIEEP